MKNCYVQLDFGEQYVIVTIVFGYPSNHTYNFLVRPIEYPVLVDRIKEEVEEFQGDVKFVCIDSWYPPEIIGMLEKGGFKVDLANNIGGN